MESLEPRPPAPRNDRILLLSLSGVRVFDPELRELGLTLPGFVRRGRTIASLPTLGLLVLAARTPPDWEVEYRDADGPEDLRTIEWERYGVVAVSALHPRARDLYAVGDLARSQGCFVVFGGLHATASPQECLRHADVVVVGEGEDLWATLLEDLRRGRARRVYRPYRAVVFRETDPAPRYDLLDPKGYDRLPLQTTRGCPYDCEFCGASRLLDPRYRRKPLGLVERELEALLAREKKRFVELADDNTFVDRSWGKGLLRLLAGAGARWFTETDVSLAEDLELLDLLAESGCRGLLVGFEATRPEWFRADSRSVKNRFVPRYARAIEAIQSRGIPVVGCFVLGHDGQGPRTFEEIPRFARETGLAEVQVTILTPFPGTALHRRLEYEGRLLPEFSFERLTLFDLVFRPACAGPQEFRSRFRDLVATLYSPEEDRLRRRRFASQARDHRDALAF